MSDSGTVEETRKNADQVAGYGIGDVVDHYAEASAALGAKPIAIGHSFGGLIVQRPLGQGHAAAGVAIDPAPIKGGTSGAGSVRIDKEYSFETDEGSASLADLFG